jgi:hypothetical protein
LRLVRILAICVLVFWWTLLPVDSASASCVTTAQSVATASESATLLNPTDTATATSAPVIVQDTCGGDDVSYQVALPSAIDFQGTTYNAVYATTNSTIVFGTMDNTYHTYPNAPSISVNAYDWVVLDPANQPQYPAGWQAPDEHLIITSSQAGFQVDLAVRPYGQDASVNPLSTIVVTASINPDSTLTITYLSNVQAGLQTRTGVRLPDGRIVTLEEAGLTRVYIAPVVTAEAIVEPTPSPSTAPSPQPTPQPTVNPTPQPTESPSPTPTEPTPTPSPEPQPTTEPTPSPTPSPEPSVTPTPQPEPNPQPEPSTTEPTPSPSPTPIPIPSPEPSPEPIPAVNPNGNPAVEPTPVPEPEPIPTFEPEPNPDTTPLPDLETEPTPEPVEPPQPEPVEPPTEIDPISPTTEPQPQTTSEIIEDVLSSGEITPADAEAVVDSLMEDGRVTEAEATALIETLSDSGALTGAEEDLILDALSADGEITQDEVNNLSETLSEDGKFTEAEKELVAEALIESADGEAVTVEAITEAGITLEDLPPAQPVEVRQDENGNEVVITAEVAVALELLTSAGDILTAAFESPAQLLFAIGNLGADMSPEERKEASETIIAATIVGNIATTTIATAVGGIGYRRMK